MRRRIAGIALPIFLVASAGALAPHPASAQSTQPRLSVFETFLTPG